ncbi:hypothetical protein [Pseudoalteromonas sp. H105]|jgi:hypothetical protein|uniref:hypothetical protein n=1 Tax=Pseudoalteromonas sp. H105 TaxID=1348393 RepID=UPI0007322AA3|nr:hypothetical protein [Pseudoalteromonas sp. H105]KTF15650.1 hypothetical protein ATS75_08935 [Pseudoalteromonas sp. H105]
MPNDSGNKSTSLISYTGNDGVDMGVLNDGTPYLGIRGLALLCGTTEADIACLIKNWDEQKHTAKGQVIKGLIESQGKSSVGLYIPTPINGVMNDVINDINCMAILEYYAFEAPYTSEQAKTNYRNLARLSLRTYIYQRTGYSQSDGVPDYWQTFHERITLNELPSGFFSVFSEIANILITSIRKGMPLDSQTMPDISVGLAWGKEWVAKSYDEKFGSRVKFQHKFPENFPQKNPDAWIYPIESLGEFRKWLDDIYLRTKFPKYLAGKVKRGQLPNLDLKSLIEEIQPIRIKNNM